MIPHSPIESQQIPLIGLLSKTSLTQTGESWGKAARRLGLSRIPASSFGKPSCILDVYCFLLVELTVGVPAYSPLTGCGGAVYFA